MMNKKEYDSIKHDLYTKYNEKMNELNREYALSNAIAGKGDIIRDYATSIVVDYIKIGFSSKFNREPECIYIGRRLTKKNKFFQPEETRSIYQSNIKEVIKSHKEL